LAKRPSTIASLQDLLVGFIDKMECLSNQSRADVSSIAGAVHELALELRAERKEREAESERAWNAISCLTQKLNQSISRLDTTENRNVREDRGLPGDWATVYSKLMLQGCLNPIEEWDYQMLPEGEFPKADRKIPSRLNRR